MTDTLTSVWKTWQRLTLPGLKTQYHQRRGLSRPSSGWDRVQIPRYNHQIIETDEKEPMKVGQLLQDLSTSDKDQAYRAISTGKLHASQRFHIRPINVMVYHGSQGVMVSR